MDYNDIKQLYDNSIRKITTVKTDFKRYLYTQINWKNRLIGIKGGRGVGKTTLILQHIKETFADLEKVLYVSVDDLWFSSHSIFDLVEYHYTHGGTHIFFDEIHRFRQWQTMLKNIYDKYDDLYIVYTGSSLLELDVREGDLSRRLRVYQLYGMSFREFLCFESVLNIKPITLDILIKNHLNIASEHVSQVKILPLFEQYLQHGYYPYYSEEGDGYFSRLQSTIRQVLDADLPEIEDVSYATIQKIKKMLMILAERVPQTPKMNELYAQLETGRDSGLKMLQLLDRAGLIALLRSESKSFKQMYKPDKIYLGDTNLSFCLSNAVNIGTLRETFFYNQLKVQHSLVLPSQGDFKVDGKWLFEVGGQNKDFSQIKDEPNSYLAIDETEYGHKNKIPLWMFGLLY
ncbi:MAG: ATP-binding protein [Bacteroidales bacterium]|nr:ATP-binding protein [Bacteroidales bacterium]